MEGAGQCPIREQPLGGCGLRFRDSEDKRWTIIELDPDFDLVPVGRGTNFSRHVAERLQKRGAALCVDQSAVDEPQHSRDVPEPGLGKQVRG
jgi:hypothetical protein